MRAAYSAAGCWCSIVSMRVRVYVCVRVRARLRCSLCAVTGQGGALLESTQCIACTVGTVCTVCTACAVCTHHPSMPGKGWQCALSTRAAARPVCSLPAKQHAARDAAEAVWGWSRAAGTGTCVCTCTSSPFSTAPPWHCCSCMHAKQHATHDRTCAPSQPLARLAQGCRMLRVARVR